VLSPNQVPTQIEQVTDSSVCTQESLSLLYRFKLTHTSLPYPGRLVRLLGPVILVPLGTVDRLWNQLKIHINNLTILVNRSPQIMLLTVDLHEDFVNVEGVAIAPVLWFQSTGINGSELDAPQADRFSADCNASFSEEIFDIAVAEAESVVEPNGIGNDVRWESVSFIYSKSDSIKLEEFTWQYHFVTSPRISGTKKRVCIAANPFVLLVGTAGFEPATTTPPV
jgi:hypothetical protein